MLSTFPSFTARREDLAMVHGKQNKATLVMRIAFFPSEERRGAAILLFG
jgi:hypothetical protein